MRNGNILLQPIRNFLRERRFPLLYTIIVFLMMLGGVYLLLQVVQGDWLGLVLFIPGYVLLPALAAYEPLRKRFITESFGLRHVLQITLYWLYGYIWQLVLRRLLVTPAVGKDSQLFYALLIAIIALTWAVSRALLTALTPFGQRTYSIRIPLWEQLMLSLNELISIGLLASVWGPIAVRLFQPDVFTTRLDVVYAIGLSGSVLIYYVGTQLMWVQRWNEWLSRNSVWVRLARFFTPFLLLVATMVIANQFTQRTDPRTANLLENTDVNLAVLSLVPVIWLLVFVLMLMVFTSRRGLRQRFFPDDMMDYLPERLRVILRAISDMDILLVLGVLTTFIPVYLLLLSDGGGFIGTARQVILQRGSALVETSEQALAVLFVLPFYVLILAMLLLYGLVIARPDLSSDLRDEFMQRLPVGTLITVAITLYLFAVPFTQIFTEGRLPSLPRDLGRILAFYLLIPVVLLYLHYFLLVRWPYGRGQTRWRDQHGVQLDHDLRGIDRRINNLNQEIMRLENTWRMAPGASTSQSQNDKMNTLYKYVQLNGERDNLNMQRLQIVSARQRLAEVSETPYSVAVARLPARIISVGIPILLAVQLYQWAVLNEGLREVTNNPNITVLDFIQILLDNIQF